MGSRRGWRRLSPATAVAAALAVAAACRSAGGAVAAGALAQGGGGGWRNPRNGDADGGGGGWKNSPDNDAGGGVGAAAGVRSDLYTVFLSAQEMTGSGRAAALAAAVRDLMHDTFPDCTAPVCLTLLGDLYFQGLVEPAALPASLRAAVRVETPFLTERHNVLRAYALWAEAAAAGFPDAQFRMAAFYGTYFNPPLSHRKPAGSGAAGAGQAAAAGGRAARGGGGGIDPAPAASSPDMSNAESGNSGAFSSEFGVSPSPESAGGAAPAGGGAPRGGAPKAGAPGAPSTAPPAAPSGAPPPPPPSPSPRSSLEENLFLLTLQVLDLGQHDSAGDPVGREVEEAILAYWRKTVGGPASKPAVPAEPPAAAAVAGAAGFAGRFPLIRDDRQSVLFHYAGAQALHVPSLLALGFRHLYGVGVPKRCGAACAYFARVAQGVAAFASAGIPPVGQMVRLNLPGGEFVGAGGSFAAGGAEAGGGASGGAGVSVGGGFAAGFAAGSVAAAGSAAAGSPATLLAIGRRLALGIDNAIQDFPAALVHFQAAAAAAPDSARPLGWLGYLHALGLGTAVDLDEAEAFFRAGLALDPEDPMCNNGMGYILFLDDGGEAGGGGEADGGANVAASGVSGAGASAAGGAGGRPSAASAASASSRASGRSAGSRPLASGSGEKVKGAADRKVGLVAGAKRSAGGGAGGGSSVSAAAGSGFAAAGSGSASAGSGSDPLYFFSKSAASNFPDGQYNLAVLHLTNLSDEPSTARAVELLTAAAEAGHAAAQYVLAVLYQNGLGVPRDCFLAASLYKRVAQKHHWVAETLQKAFRLQRQRATDEAAFLYWQLAEAGVELAQSNLGQLLDGGAGLAALALAPGERGQSPVPLESFRHRTRAALRALERAVPVFGRRSSVFRPVRLFANRDRGSFGVNAALAQRYWELAAEQRSTNAMLMLAEYPMRGWGVETCDAGIAPAAAAAARRLLLQNPRPPPGSALPRILCRRQVPDLPLARFMAETTTDVATPKMMSVAQRDLQKETTSAVIMSSVARAELLLVRLMFEEARLEKQARRRGSLFDYIDLPMLERRLERVASSDPSRQRAMAVALFSLRRLLPLAAVVRRAFSRRPRAALDRRVALWLRVAAAAAAVAVTRLAAGWWKRGGAAASAG